MKPYNERLPLIDAAIDYFTTHYGGYPSECQYMVEFCTEKGDWTAVYHSDNYLFTHDEFNQRKAERQNKPSWADAPEWANWLAQSSGGHWYWYSQTEKVVAGATCYLSIYGRVSRNICGEVIGNWQDTLEKRPKKTLEEIGAHIEESRMNTDIWSGKPKGQDMNNDWYEKGELPPVGDTVRYETTFFTMKKFNKGICKIIAYHDDKVWIDKDGNTDSVINVDVIQFRPLRTETDKLVEQAISDAEKHTSLISTSTVESLIKAGYRKIKPMSEDEFVVSTTNFGVSGEGARFLFKRGCRFIDKE